MRSDSTTKPGGLRARKQSSQRAQIIENAIALFRQSGFDAVPVRAIAAQSDVSEATFFNYFPSKDAVLAEWAHAAVDACFERAASASAAAGLRRQVRAAVRDLAGRVEADRDLMREAWSRARLVCAATDRNGAPLRGRPAESEGRPVRDLIERARNRGELRADVSPEELAALLCAGLHAVLARALVPRGGERLEDRLVRTADLMLDGFRKRNERVRPGATRSPAPGPPPPPR
jgi:AcrR family transcriptional regulator